MERLGREREWERETELLVPWLEVEALRDLADDSSCESDTDCCSDLKETQPSAHQSLGPAIEKSDLDERDSLEAAWCLEKPRLAVPFPFNSVSLLSLGLPLPILLLGERSAGRSSDSEGASGALTLASSS